jgi:sugar phosphate isomerase/epimerase
LKYGAMNSPFLNVPYEIRSIASMSFNYVELTIEGPYSMLRNLVSVKNEILDLTHVLGIDLLGHVPWSVESGPLHRMMSDEYTDRLHETIRLAHELGINLMTIHPPMLSKHVQIADRRRILRHFIVATSRAVSEAQNLGCGISVENMDHESFTIDDFKELFKEVPDLGFTLDVGHANIGTPKNLAQVYLTEFGTRLKHIHISDNLGGYADLHLPIGAGTINFRNVIRAIRRTQYEATMTLEVFSSDRSYLRISKEKISQMLRA